MVSVQREKGEEAIDLFPEGWLWDRWVDLHRVDECHLITPKGQRFEIQVWGNMPMIKKDALALVLADLPPLSVVGRSGSFVERPITNRVMRTTLELQCSKVLLPTLKDIFEPQQVTKIEKRYRAMPESYYSLVDTEPVTPEMFEKSLLNEEK